MKYIFTIIMISSLFQSCKDPSELNIKARFIQFEIKNESSKDVTIYLYKRNNDFYKSVNVYHGDSAILDEGYETPPYTPTYAITVSIDSAVILFSDNKRLIQTFENRGNNDTVNNILDRSFYSEINKKYKFSLKQSDYLRSK